jgi:hypothetical protein
MSKPSTDPDEQLRAAAQALLDAWDEDADDFMENVDLVVERMKDLRHALKFKALMTPPPERGDA